VASAARGSVRWFGAAAPPGSRPARLPGRGGGGGTVVGMAKPRAGQAAGGLHERKSEARSDN
jgi:hypothetical protein